VHTVRGAVLGRQQHPETLVQLSWSQLLTTQQPTTAHAATDICKSTLHMSVCLAWMLEGIWVGLYNPELCLCTMDSS
jgi:hypothetical protein